VTDRLLDAVGCLLLAITVIKQEQSVSTSLFVINLTIALAAGHRKP
jgi:hypothetical protein